MIKLHGSTHFGTPADFQQMPQQGETGYKRAAVALPAVPRQWPEPSMGVAECRALSREAIGWIAGPRLMHRKRFTQMPRAGL